MMDKRTTVDLLKFYADIDNEISFKYELYGNTPHADTEVWILRQLKAGIADSLDGMPYIQKDVLFRHYVKGIGWEKIRRKHWYSNRQIRNIANDALEELGARFESCEAVQNFLLRKEGHITS